MLGAQQYGNTRSAADLHKLEITWRVEWAVGVVLPLALVGSHRRADASVLYFRMKLMNSTLYQESALRSKVPYWLFFKKYWPRLIGTFGSWFTLVSGWDAVLARADFSNSSAIQQACSPGLSSGEPRRKRH